jgi:DNA-directed RNA polymerase subunit RPC12/RpoP
LPCPRCSRRSVVVPESAVHSCPRCSSKIKASDVARRA